MYLGALGMQTGCRAELCSCQLQFLFAFFAVFCCVCFGVAGVGGWGGGEKFSKDFRVFALSGNIFYTQVGNTPEFRMQPIFGNWVRL